MHVNNVYTSSDNKLKYNKKIKNILNDILKINIYNYNKKNYIDDDIIIVITKK